MLHLCDENSISYSAWCFVEEMQMQGFNMVRCFQGAKTLSLPMQMLGADLQAHKVIYNNNPILKWCLTNTGIYKLKEMDADHVTACSNGGATDISNCTMLAPPTTGRKAINNPVSAIIFLYLLADLSDKQA